VIDATADRHNRARLLGYRYGEREVDNMKDEAPVSTPAVDGSPGSHPHSNRPNWQAGDDDADELLHQKIADAQRAGSDVSLPNCWGCHERMYGA
jgi:hypothetical protein